MSHVCLCLCHICMSHIISIIEIYFSTLPVCFHVLLAVDICFESLLAVGTHKRSLLLYNVQVPYSLWSKEIIILFKTVSGKRSFETLIRCLAMISVNSIKSTDNLFLNPTNNRHLNHPYNNFLILSERMGKRGNRKWIGNGCVHFFLFYRLPFAPRTVLTSKIAAG